MTTAAPFIRFRGLHKSFGRNHVLRGVDLDVEPGETVVILGGSGSGKSVLLKHTIALLRPDEGEVWVDGTEVSGLGEDALPDVRLKVGMLFQAGALFDSMTVYDNVAYALREHSGLDETAIAERVHEVLGHVELPGVEGLMPAALSGGQRKRVALARAIALQPEVVLYDEPTTGLDPLTGQAINALIRTLQRTLRVTSVVVTHDILSARAVADRIAWLRQGRVEYTGTLAEAARGGPDSLRQFLRAGGGAGEAERV